MCFRVFALKAERYASDSASLSVEAPNAEHRPSFSFVNHHAQVLIFSQMTKMLDILQDYCWLRKFGFCRLDGSMAFADREIQIADFYNDADKFIFLLSTRAGGLGLNLMAADTCILFDSDWVCLCLSLCGLSFFPKNTEKPDDHLSPFRVPDCPTFVEPPSRPASARPLPPYWPERDCAGPAPGDGEHGGPAHC